MTTTVSGGGGGGSSTLAGDTDVAISSPAQGQGLIYDGANWANRNPLGMAPFIAPPTAAGATWGWTNQGGATVVDEANGLYFAIPASSAVNWRIYDRAQPSTPWTVTAAFYASIWSVNVQQVGLCIRDSGTGKLTGFSYAYSAGYFFYVVRNTNATTYSADAAVIRLWQQQLIWLQITDNGTTRAFNVSMDGLHWVQIYSEARTAWAAGDHVGIYLESESPSIGPQMRLVSWH